VSVNEPADSPEEPEATASVRVSIARAALQAALGVSGVLDADPGTSRLRLTADPPSGVLVGVSVAALPDGRYGVDLSLVAEMVSLPELAEEVRARVHARVRRDGLEDVLGSIDVEFAQVMTRDECAAAAAKAQREAEEALAAQERRAAAGLDERAEALAPEAAATAPTEVPEAVAEAAPAERGPAAEERLAAAGGATMPAAATIAARQAALATDQAALAAKQAALAAEQAAIASGPGTAVGSGGPAAGPGAAVGSGGPAAGSTQRDAEEREA
jgi:hypothetical protein